MAMELPRLAFGEHFPDVNLRVSFIGKRQQRFGVAVPDDDFGGCLER
jgi:hypothetical protein